MQLRANRFQSGIGKPFANSVVESFDGLYNQAWFKCVNAHCIPGPSMNSRFRINFLCTIITFSCLLTIQDNLSLGQELPPVYKTDFESGADDWQFIDSGWEVKKTDTSSVLSQHTKKSDYTPKVRSPLHLALLKNKVVSDFRLDARVLSTHEDYNHRDVCLFFGYQSPTQFYYVHLGKKADPHANQIFIVNNAERTKISTKTTSGTDWDQKWHHVRIERNASTGDIKVYFDDMKEPVMTAVDKTFAWGQIGLGSFDDTADWDDIVLKGRLHSQD